MQQIQRVLRYPAKKPADLQLTVICFETRRFLLIGSLGAQRQNKVNVVFDICLSPF